MNLLPSLSFIENNAFKISIRKFARLKFKIDEEQLKFEGWWKFVGKFSSRMLLQIHSSVLRSKYIERLSLTS